MKMKTNCLFLQGLMKLVNRKTINVLRVKLMRIPNNLLAKSTSIPDRPVQTAVQSLPCYTDTPYSYELHLYVMRSMLPQRTYLSRYFWKLILTFHVFNLFIHLKDHHHHCWMRSTTGRTTESRGSSWYWSFIFSSHNQCCHDARTSNTSTHENRQYSI